VYTHAVVLISLFEVERIMIEIKKINPRSKKEVNEFVHFPFKIYEGVEQWVPPILADIKTMLNPDKHPYYEHSDAEWFIARENGKIVGRIGLLENKSYNQYHNKKQASFYLFECEDKQDTAFKLFDYASEWAKNRGLDYLLGPKGLSSFDGYGFQVEGFEHRQMMTMMNYNLENYPKFAEAYGFEKIVDWVSSYVKIADFKLPEKISEIAHKVEERGKFKVERFKNKADLKRWANRIGHAYNKCFVNNWEYYPLTDREIKFVLDNIMVVAVPELIKIITYNDEVVGFLLAFPDISAALQRHKGQLTPWALVDYLRELKRTDFISFNGVGVLPEYQGRGGNYLLFSEIYKSANSFNYIHGELTQIAESAKQMRNDLENLGVRPYKNHRIYGKKI
jgi:GNAT superfamily N-acetyltransferase